jgi:hypothetical protein
MKFDNYLKEHDEVVNPLNESFLKLAGGLVDKIGKKLYDKALQMLAKKFVKRYPGYKELSDEVEDKLKDSKGNLDLRTKREYLVRLGKLKRKAENDKSLPKNAVASLFNPIQNMLSSKGTKNVRNDYTKLSALNKMLGKVS